jgi:anti-anti-sigma factor
MKGETTVIDPAPTTLRLEGDVDHRLYDELQKRVVGGGWSGSEPILLDVSRVTYIDSGGLSSLVRFSHYLASRNQRLTLYDPPRSLVHVLKTTGLHQFFSMIPNEIRGSSPRVASNQPQWQYVSMSLPGHVSYLSLARERAVSMAKALPFTVEDLDEIELGVGEALTNAIRHGCAKTPGDLFIECETTEEAFVFKVTDPGGGFDPGSVPEPAIGSLQEGGMGIYFMQRTMDAVSFSFDERGTTVKLVKKLKVSGERR